MCEKKPYNGRRIDPCMVEQIAVINECIDDIDTIACCCGHGKYAKTIITRNRFTNEIYEFFSHIKLADAPRKSRKYYKKDAEGYYYIPEVVNKDRKS